MKLIVLIYSLYSFSAFAASAWFGAAPDNSQTLILNVLKSARKEVLINIYQFTNPLFRDEIIKLVDQGVTVKMLVEGQPYLNEGRKTHGTMLPDMRDNIQAIWTAMKKSSNTNNRIYILYAKGEKKRRFTYDHAKYMVVDGVRTFVSSDNLTRTTAPEPGRIGSRGWHIFVEDKLLAHEITDMFNEDSHPKNVDIVDLRQDPFPPAPGEPSKPRTPEDRETQGFPVIKGDVEVEQIITSPHSEEAIVKFILSAKSSVELEFATLTSFWKEDGEFETNPILQALLDAAKRKVLVKILLNDDETYGPLPVKARTNLRAACFAQRIASGYKLPLTAKIVDREKSEIAYIHNKGIIIDNARVFVSSINGTKNSMQKNRELGIVLGSNDAADYYGTLFDHDWNHSPKIPFKTCEEFKKLE